MAQELLTTFDGEIDELTLKPGTGGVFEVSVNEHLVWSRKQQERFPEITELKQRVRDVIAPERSLGHIDARQAAIEVINRQIRLSRCNHTLFADTLFPYLDF